MITHMHRIHILAEVGHAITLMVVAGSASRCWAMHVGLVTTKVRRRIEGRVTYRHPALQVVDHLCECVE